MDYKVRLEGASPLIMHSTRGMDPTDPAVAEIKELSAKRGTNKTVADDERVAFLETKLSFWLDDEEQPTVPADAVRSCIETAARKLKHGPLVREGLVVIATDFHHNIKGDLDEIAARTKFTTTVVVQRNRILRSRAKFDEWALDVHIDCDDDLIDTPKIEQWLDIAGRRIGLGDWRPQKSGTYGRFTF